MGTRSGDTDAAQAPGDRTGKRVRWTKAMREAFLDHLAATCNVKESAAVIGVIAGSVYRLRRRDPHFAAAWEEALALGYQMLETRVIGHVLAGGTRHEPLGCDADGNLGGIDFESALRLLVAHRNVPGKPRGRGAGPQYAAREETDAMLLKQLKLIEARRVRKAQWAATVAAGKARQLTHDAGASAPVAASDAVIEQQPNVKAVGDGE
ncbi:hypothetical protein ABS767_03205 [Sphingomonas sp. ST-64]|uniref:Uncharacterized protein n=1 Tax=Sphingomonas plantiphila TaxID=3163295 RepID=A0ABW8YKI1_9SPHN